MSVLDTNEYFDVNVKSIGFQTETLRATVGVMAPGETPRTSAGTNSQGSGPIWGF